MRKVIVLMSFLILLFNCEKKTTVKGMVGQKIHLAPTITSKSDTAGCFFRWEFEKKPTNSRLDVLNFQPNNRNYNIYFIPDAAGEYLVKCMIIESDGVVKESQKFLCPVVEDTLGVEKDTLEAADSAAIAPEYGEDTTTVQQDTTIKPKKREKPKTETIAEAEKPVKRNGYKYTIQLVARKSYNKAKQDVDILESHNLDVYLQKRHFDNTGETWYRVRTGTFDNYYKAKQNAKKLSGKLAKDGYFNLWVDYQRK
ncbi:MAG: SPOR domain-containing protein [Candidatus Marinimicrobia bacterium]|nr:SPOR domain-containing protein [Candidatus Neomarinimicrobiota bacterium]